MGVRVSSCPPFKDKSRKGSFLVVSCVLTYFWIKMYKLSASVRWGIWGKYSNIKPILAILGRWDLLALLGLYLHLFTNYLHPNFIFFKINYQFLPIYLAFSQAELVQVDFSHKNWDFHKYLWDWNASAGVKSQYSVARAMLASDETLRYRRFKSVIWQAEKKFRTWCFSQNEILLKKSSIF